MRAESTKPRGRGQARRFVLRKDGRHRSLRGDEAVIVTCMSPSDPRSQFSHLDARRESLAHGAGLLPVRVAPPALIPIFPHPRAVPFITARPIDYRAAEQSGSPWRMGGLRNGGVAFPDQI